MLNQLLGYILETDVCSEAGGVRSRECDVICDCGYGEVAEPWRGTGAGDVYGYEYTWRALACTFVLGKSRAPEPLDSVLYLFLKAVWRRMGSTCQDSKDGR